MLHLNAEIAYFRVRLLNAYELGNIERDTIEWQVDNGPFNLDAQERRYIKRLLIESFDAQPSGE